MPEIILYGLPLSGHSHRVEECLRLLHLPYGYKIADDAVRQSEAFRALNPLGQIPVIKDGDLVLADSNAILVYLARRYDQSGRWYPQDVATTAAVQRWLSIAAGEIRFGPALARVITLFGRPGDLHAAQALAQRIFIMMNGHLADRSFLAADHPTIADLACFSYTAHAPEGGISLAPYPHIQAWIDRVLAIPGFQDMATPS